MQDSFSLKLLVQLGLENDARVESGLDTIHTVYGHYHSLCYFHIHKRYLNQKKEGRTKNV